MRLTRLKYAFFALICAMSVFLTGCGNKTTYKNGIADIKSANITVSFPEGWTVGVNDDAYGVISDKVNSGNANEIKERYESVGAQMLLSAHSSDDSVTVTVIQSEKGDMSTEEKLQLQHDNTVYNFRSLGFFTESSVGEYEWGGVLGYLSVVRAFDKEGDTECITEGRQFYFERGELVFSLVIEFVGGSKEGADVIDISSTV